VSADFQCAGRDDLNTGDFGRFQRGKNVCRGGRAGAGLMFQNPDECEEDRGGDEPDCCVFRVHYFLRASQTTPLNNKIAPGSAPSSSQPTSRSSVCVIISRNSVTGRGPMPASNCWR